MDDNPCKCGACGKFLSYEEMSNDTARFEHLPLSDFGPEVSEWTCASCVAREREAN